MLHISFLAKSGRYHQSIEVDDGQKDEGQEMDAF
jgi:hypothetical protein